MLKVTNIQKSFNGHHVLKGIDFEINKGEVVAILGPSGSGKTTFLRCLNCVVAPQWYSNNTTYFLTARHLKM